MLYPGYELEELRNGSLMPRLLIGRRLAQPSSSREQEPCYECWDLCLLNLCPTGTCQMLEFLRMSEVFGHPFVMTRLC